MPTGEVETLFTTMGLTMNLSDGNRPFGEEERSNDHGAEASYDSIESPRHSVHKDNIKALMSMGDALKRTFSDRVAPVHPQNKKTCPNIDILKNSALTLKSHGAGSDKTWVHLPPSHPIWQAVAIKEPEWTVLMEIIQDDFIEMDCLMIQQIAQAKEQAVMMKKRSNMQNRWVGSTIKDLQTKREEDRKQPMETDGNRKLARARRTSKQSRLLANRRRTSQRGAQVEWCLWQQHSVSKRQWQQFTSERKTTRAAQKSAN